jgi:hypothetical protein
MIEQSEDARSAFPTPGAAARPAPDVAARPALHAVADPEPEPETARVAPRAPVMERLLELDRRRRELHEWMDAEDSGMAIDPQAGSWVVPTNGTDPNLEA